MQDPDGATLAECGEKVRNLFIPDTKGDYRGTLSGILFENERAKRLEKIDAAVLSLLGRDPEAYEIWWTTLYDEVLNLAAADNRIRGFVQRVLADVERGDAQLAAAGAWERSATRTVRSMRSRFRRPTEPSRSVSRRSTAGRSTKSKVPTRCSRRG